MNNNTDVLVDITPKVEMESKFKFKLIYRDLPENETEESLDQKIDDYIKKVGINTFTKISPIFQDLEAEHCQTIEVTNEELENPNVVLNYLDMLKNEYNLTLDYPTSPNFFKKPNANKNSFDKKLSMNFNDLFVKSMVKAYHYLVLLNRKVMPYNFDNIQSTYNFNIKDIYQITGIEPFCFESVSDIPSNIVKRCKMSYESNQLEVKRFITKLTNLEEKRNALKNQLEFTSTDSSIEDEQKRETKIREIQKEIKKVGKDAEKIVFDIEDLLYKNERVDTPTPDDVITFISDFVCYGINVNQSVLKDGKRNGIKEEDGITFMTDEDAIRQLKGDNLYFQDHINYTWVHFEKMLSGFVSRIAPTLQTKKDTLSDIGKGVLQNVKSKKRVIVFAFKPHTLFCSNGQIELEYQKDGSITYNFKRIKGFNKRDLMFKYATKFRMAINYNENVDYVFSDNEENEPVTPDYIFGALGRRGFEVTEYTSDDERIVLDKEAKARANLLMQFTMKTLLPYEKIPVIYDCFLYLFNATHSGKSTFMTLIQNLLGIDLAAPLKMKDFSQKSEFGLINVKNKLAVLIDEASNGIDVTDTENIKAFSSQEPMLVNKKSQDYELVQPEGSLIMASNNAAKFSDETGATEKRMLAFELETGYSNGTSNATSGNGAKDLSFIKGELIHDDNFKSACIKWILEHCNIRQEVPQSIKDAASRLVSSEDDVQSFIVDKIRGSIEEPLFITPDHLYELYKAENISKGRNINKIRNKSNFKKALAKLRNDVYLLKDVTHSKIEIRNRMLELTGVLFSEINRAQMNHTLNNHLSDVFMSTLKERNKELNLAYESLSMIKNKQLKISEVSLGKRSLYAIMPDLPQYSDDIEEKAIRKIISNQKDRFLKKLFDDDNRGYIQNQNYNRLPICFSISANNTFSSYSVKKEKVDSDHLFSEFTSY
ncbi:DUF5906 domain-containing protein [Mammaliicoccus sciuri]|uniref:DUF5906 domain-containing protein n=1 Tax=Mammaliicoccus sciuri TaxID=1296 RepID=UPI003F551C2F